MSKQIKDGGSAFPYNNGLSGLGAYCGNGMTLRQWYAGKALEGLCVSWGAEEYSPNDVLATIPNLTKWAFAFADSMIAHEEKEAKQCHNPNR